jgi:regulation of enolase protein 1 (concanavalin A-like superfamily)
MHGFMLVVLGSVLSADPVAITRNTMEMDTRRFAMPLLLTEPDKAKSERVRLFVSQDRGKSWQHVKDCKPTEELVRFTAEDDGLYWFALQVVGKDGNRKPAKLENLEPDVKVYVNTEGRTLKVQKTYGELVQEVEGLRTKVERLEQRIKELEAGRKPKQGKPESPAPAGQQPWVTGWDRPVDPKGDCSIERKGDRLTITVPGEGHEVDIASRSNRMNGPRLLRDVEGDFVVEVRVSGDNWASEQEGFRGAGLLVADADKGHGLTLKVQVRCTVSGRDKLSEWVMSEEHHPRGFAVFAPAGHNRTTRPRRSTYFRLERRGDAWRRSWSEDSNKWHEYSEALKMRLPRKLKVGVLAEADAEGEFKVVFDKFRLSRPAK